jgi:hypothetical protein
MPGVTCTTRSTVALPGYSVTLWIGASMADALQAISARMTDHCGLIAIEYLSEWNDSVSVADGKQMKNTQNHRMASRV